VHKQATNRRIFLDHCVGVHTSTLSRPEKLGSGAGFRSEPAGCVSLLYPS
jgi:hypothetical protein